MKKKVGNPDKINQSLINLIEKLKNYFMNVHQGSYGPALSAAKGLFPGVTTPLAGLWMCGASTFPGIGIPPVAASGALAAHAVLGRQAQAELLRELGI